MARISSAVATIFRDRARGAVHAASARAGLRSLLEALKIGRKRRQVNFGVFSVP
jgi:hypothetical protein